MTKRHQQGFGLTETLLTLGAISALTVGIYMVLAPTSASATTKKEQDNLQGLSSAVERSWGLLGSYSGVSTERVEADGLAPTRMRFDGRLRTSWGTPVDVVPHRVREPGDSFLVSYPLAPAEVCARLASAVARSVYDVRVDGVSVFDEGRLNPAAAAAACGQRDSASMEFVYYSGLVAGTAVAAPPLVMPPASGTTPMPSTPTHSSPVGPVDPAAPAAPVAPVLTPPPAVVAPAPPAAPATPGPPAGVTPAPSVMPPTPGAPGEVTACQPRTDTQNRNTNTCPAGAWGYNAERRIQPWTCPEAWDTPEPGAWSAWSQNSSHCNACPRPAVERQTQWLGSGGANCPSGHYGGTSWEREQAQERSRSYNCPAGTASLPAPSFSPWSGWSDTGATRNGSGSCQACPPAQTQRETQWVGGGSQPCPAGQEGSHTWEREQARERSGTYDCPAGTASLPAISWSAPSAWADTGSRRNESNTCTPSAPPPQACMGALGSPTGPVLVSGYACVWSPPEFENPGTFVRALPSTLPPVGETRNHDRSSRAPYNICYRYERNNLASRGFDPSSYVYFDTQRTGISRVGHMTFRATFELNGVTYSTSGGVFPNNTYSTSYSSLANDAYSGGGPRYYGYGMGAELSVNGPRIPYGSYWETYQYSDGPRAVMRAFAGLSARNCP